MGRRVHKIKNNVRLLSTLSAQKKMICSKGIPSLQILEYSTPRPEFKTQIWTSNFVGTKFFRCQLRINFFWHQLRSSLEFSHSHLVITSFWRQFGSSLGLDIHGDSSRGFLLALPYWGLQCLSFRGELHISLLGFYYDSPFLGNYINHQKDKIAFTPINPVANYIYIADLNTRLCVGWKTLPNLNFKL